MLIHNEYKPQMVTKAAASAKPKHYSGRTALVMGGLTLFFGAVVARGYYLQTADKDKLMQESDKRMIATEVLHAQRGSITDRNGTLLAFSVPTETLYATPYILERVRTNPRPSPKQKDALAQLPQNIAKLAAVLEMTPEELQAKLALTAENKNRAVMLKRHMSKEMSDAVKGISIPGLYTEEESQRHYPMGSLFSQTIGFNNIDDKGQEGLERANNALLAGKDGSRVVLRDNLHNFVDTVDSEQNRPAVNGANLVLSLDSRIQALAADTLAKTVAYHNAVSGSAIVLDAKTGEVLAMVNVPTFDANHPGESDPAARRNRVVTDMIEPGSTMKPFTIAQALDAGKVAPNTVLNTNSYAIGPAVVRDTHNYPSLSITGVMQKSSNVGASKLSAMFGREEVYNYYKHLGMGQSTASGFPGESGGFVRPWQKWYPIDQATMSFGYGIQMTLLQLVRGYTVFTNDGALLPITYHKLERAPQGEPVIKPQTARQIRAMMTTVTEAGGTGTAAAIPGFDVAGKSGTAQKYVNGRYADNEHSAIFAGFAPAQNPRVIVAVYLDTPRANGYYGGKAAGPAFRDIMAGTLNILGVPPTKAVSAKVQKPVRNKPKS